MLAKGVVLKSKRVTTKLNFLDGADCNKVGVKLICRVVSASLRSCFISNAIGPLGALARRRESQRESPLAGKGLIAVEEYSRSLVFSLTICETALSFLLTPVVNIEYCETRL